MKANLDVETGGRVIAYTGTKENNSQNFETLQVIFSTYTCIQDVFGLVQRNYNGEIQTSLLV